MNETASKVIKAHNVIVNAFANFDESGRIRQRAEKLRKDRKKSLEKRYLTIAVMAFFAAVILAIIVGNGIDALQEKGIEIFSKILPFIGRLILPSIGIALVILLLPGYKANRKKIDKECDDMVEQSEQVYAQGVQLMNENAETLEIIPANYRYPLATNYLIECLTSGRADNISAALDRFDEQLHRWKVEQNQQQIMIQQQLQSEQLNNINRSIAYNTAATIGNGIFDLMAHM